MTRCIHYTRANILRAAISNYRMSSFNRDTASLTIQDQRDSILWKAINTDDMLLEKEIECGCPTKKDKAVDPDHYVGIGGLRCHEAQRAMLTPEEFAGYWVGNAVKYIWRWRKKNGIQDLKKAARCLKFLIDELERKGPDDDRSGTTDH